MTISRKQFVLSLAALAFPLLLSGNACLAVEPQQANEMPIILAHRGGMGEFDENTLHAFKNCYERGIRGYEIDIRMTQDGELVVLHDDKFDRTHDGSGAVEHQNAADVRQIKTRKVGEPLLFLTDFLDYFADKPDVYIELEMKTGNKEFYPEARLEEYVEKLYTLAEAKRPATSTYIYASFDERPLRLIHARNPKAPMSFIMSKPCTPEFIQKAKEIGADRIACNIDGTSRAAVREAHKAGLKVNGWPGRGPADYQLAVALGLDVHCTDFPLAVQESANK